MVQTNQSWRHQQPVVAKKLNPSDVPGSEPPLPTASRCVYPGLSTFTTQNAKRTFWNACSERRGVFSGFMDPRSVRILFLLPAKRIHSSTWSFSRSFQAVQEQNLQALTCTILLKTRQNQDPSLACRALFEGRKNRIRVWPAQRLLKPLKKDSILGLPDLRLFVQTVLLSNTKQHQTLKKSF